MEPNVDRLVAAVNLLADAFYPHPDDPGPIGPPWGPWVREAWVATVQSRHFGIRGDLVALNPQPLPPGEIVALNPQPLPPADLGIGFAKALAYVALRRASAAGSDQGSGLLLKFADDWCGTVVPIPLPKPGNPGDPRPPRPEESLVLGATLIRAAKSAGIGALTRSADEAGRKILEFGLSGLS